MSANLWPASRPTAVLSFAPFCIAGVPGGAPAPPPPRDTRCAVLRTVPATAAQTYGRLVIRLAKGAAWLQGEAYEIVDFAPGNAVTIRNGVLGSFYLSTPSGTRIRVTRMR
jgi:hypothetical protein